MIMVEQNLEFDEFWIADLNSVKSKQAYFVCIINILKSIPFWALINLPLSISIST